MGGDWRNFQAKETSEFMMLLSLLYELLGSVLSGYVLLKQFDHN